MSGERAFIKNFEDWKGIDYRRSPLTDTRESFQTLSNCELSSGYSLQKTKGFQVVGQGGYFTGLHSYSYLDQTTGETKEELLGINRYLWRLKSSFLTVTGGANMGYQMQVNVISSTSTANVFRFTLYSGGAPVTLAGNPYLDLGIGKEKFGSGLVAIRDLQSTIDATALTCSIPAGIRSAVVNGTQNNVTTITVTAGHNYVAGDWLSLYDFGTSELVVRRVTAVTATTITCDGGVASEVVSVVNGQWLGALAAPAASIPITDLISTTSASIDIPFQYWEPVYFYRDDGFLHFKCLPFDNAMTDFKSSSPKFTPWKGINAGDCVYFVGDYGDYGDVDKERYDPTGPVYTFRGQTRSYCGLIKYDGQNYYGAGIPQTGFVPLTAIFGGGGALSAGVYSWTGTFQQIDNQGNIMESNPGTRVVTGTATALQQCSLAAVGLSAGIATEGRFWNFNNALVSGNQVGNLASITVVAGHSLQVGDVATFFNNTTLAVQRLKITARTNTTISFASAVAINVLNNEPISNNFTVRLYRTKVGGVEYYLSKEMPNNAVTGSLTFVDGVADASLTEKLIFPSTGEEHDYPNGAYAGCTHQGVLAIGGGNTQGNTVWYSLPENLEYMPIATTNFDVPSSILGPITALGSDTDDRLAAFKSNAYYDIAGSLSTLAYSIRTISEGDFGISSQACLSKINSRLMGVGQLGFIAVQNGQMERVGDPINSAIWNSNLLNLRRAVAFNDSTARRYECNIPDITFLESGDALSFVYDYQNDGRWFNRFYYAGLDPSIGFGVYQNKAYFCSCTADALNSVIGQVYRRHELSSVLTDPSKLYAANTYPIQQAASTIADIIAEPSIYKEFLRVKMYSFFGLYEEDMFVPHTLLVSAFRNFQASIATPVDGYQVTFLTIDDFEQLIKLQTGKARSIQLLFRNVNIHESFHITGYELVVATPYLLEDMLK